MLAAWLLVSFPTNTHTFFYRSTIADVAGHDLATTRGYLLQLRDNVKTTDNINRKIDQLDREVQTQLVALDNEIDNMANPGFGPRAKAILSPTGYDPTSEGNSRTFLQKRVSQTNQCS